MTRRLLRITAQIVQLQREAEKLREKEVAGVVARIKEAIAYYDLTAEDLGLGERRGGKPAAGSKKVMKAGKGVAKRRAPSAAKYRDPASGRTWSGRGRAPQWFKAALEAGATRESLQIG